jgi:tRNA-splicing ligase RtcB (3'-phosphate/5'-hydroxy nucleic acid ligase)
MKTLILTGQELKLIGYPQGKIIGLIIRKVSENYTDEQKEYVLNLLKGILKRPDRFLYNEKFGEAAHLLLGLGSRKFGENATLAEEADCGKPITV